MKKKIAYVGIDYHKNSLTIAVRIDGEKEIHDTIRIRNEDKIIRKYMKKISKDFDIEHVMKPLQAGTIFIER